MAGDRGVAERHPWPRALQRRQNRDRPDGYLYATTGWIHDGRMPQDRNSSAGKILRLGLDGSVPEDNPFDGSYVYSYGHRNPQGLARDAEGRLFSAEHGEAAHDEINLITPGTNYGWPAAEGAGVPGLGIRHLGTAWHRLRRRRARGRGACRADPLRDGRRRTEHEPAVQEQLSRVRGFFYVVGLAAYAPEDLREFVDSIVDLTAMLSSLAEREGLDAKEAREVATVTIAAIRGLLLQELLTPGTRSEDAITLILRMREGRPAPRSRPER
ncbi:PQQ-dependent sugar dehydrogenase [Streptomyces capillispiralis]|uniref:PQQ-dependent sugar dehydrogenase n=1 Tax=Streptomyces capillispiralis TaxID=68182 RepID=UPI003696EBAC